METIKRTIVLATTILSLSSFANEGNLKSAFNYDYVSVELGSLTIDGLSGSFDYTGFSGAVSISDNYYISINNIQDRESGGDISISSYGLGSHYALNDTTDLVSKVSFIDIQASSGGVSASGDGAGLSFGIKNKIHKNINIGAEISYTTIEGVSDTAFTFGAEFEMPITEGLSLGAGLVSDGDISTKYIGLKYNL